MSDWLIGDRFDAHGFQGEVVEQIFAAKFPDPGFTTTIGYRVRLLGGGPEHLMFTPWQMAGWTKLPVTTW